MSEPTDESTPGYTVKAEKFMAVDRITQELITQKLQAAIEQLDIITAAIREDDQATPISLVYVNAVDARTLVDGAMKMLPWAPTVAPDRRRIITAPPPD